MNARVRQSRMATHRGSALILAVVLTSLLAMVAVLFLMAARVDKMASSATVESRELAFAVDSLVSQIEDVLADDVPATAKGPEYFDYPDANDPWLADLEPYYKAGSGDEPNTSYCWRQISDVTGYLERRGFSRRDVPVDPAGIQDVIREYSDIVLTGGQLADQLADADGDGIADSKWIELEGLTSSRGQPIYAAVRIVDNGGMLNANTGYEFKRTGGKHNMDGHTQLQVNLLALKKSPPDVNGTVLEARANYSAGRAAEDLKDWTPYERDVIWKYRWPDGGYTPFDLSDELELRSRFCVNNSLIQTRIEPIWSAIGAGSFASRPYDASSGYGLSDWCWRVADPNTTDRDKRHLLTTYNMDRIIVPKRVSTDIDPNRMVCVNSIIADPCIGDTTKQYAIQQAVDKALEGTDISAFGDPAQIAANLIDYVDADNELTVVGAGKMSSPWYGFEQPYICISELAYRIVVDSGRHESYAVELFKPYFEDAEPDTRPAAEWRLFIDNPADNDMNVPIVWSGTRRFHVLLAEDEDGKAPMTSEYLSFRDPQEPNDAKDLYGYDRSEYTSPSPQQTSFKFTTGATIELRRRAPDGKWQVVDSKKVPTDWIKENQASALTRDIRPEKCLFRRWADRISTPSLGNAKDSFEDPNDKRQLQAHPTNKPLVNIGELGMVLARNMAGVWNMEPNDAVINLQNPAYANLLNYLTVIDPEAHGAAKNETRVKGRININTAPVFVLEQLPWMRYRCDPNTHAVTYDSNDRATAIINYRDTNGPFTSTAGLLQVPEMRDLAADGYNNLYDANDTAKKGPDLTKDEVTDDLEERDLIFQRISDLVTVRSDVFTVYMLVRIGTNGTQRRVVAVLDRSDVTATGGSVHVVALYQVPYTP